MNHFVVLLSGHGSTLQALIDATRSGLLPPNALAGVISNRPEAYGLERAKAAQLPTAVVDHTAYSDRLTFEKALTTALFAMSPHPFVILAGFMRILGTDFIEAVQGRVLNIHPSLLPKYKGTRTYEAVLSAKDPVHGTTVHLVDHTLDGGPIVAQASVPVFENDTVETLKARTQAKEHWLYPRVLKLWVEGKLTLCNRLPFFLNQPLPPQGLEEAQLQVLDLQDKH